MKIITNNHWRKLLSGYELTEKERQEFDDLDSSSFFRYKGEVYALHDFMKDVPGGVS